MKITKKIKCLYCNTEISGNTSCKCGAVKIINEKVINGKEGQDYVDISPQLLNEVV